MRTKFITCLLFALTAAATVSAGTLQRNCPNMAAMQTAQVQTA